MVNQNDIKSAKFNTRRKQIVIHREREQEIEGEEASEVITIIVKQPFIVQCLCYKIPVNFNHQHFTI